MTAKNARWTLSGEAMWTATDLHDLRRWRIESHDPAPPLPRFQVEMAPVEGEYQVIDTLLRYRPTHTISALFSDPRAVADAIADELNAKYARESEPHP